ncbi:MAG: aminomethyl-transferring glycine dehydrogenase subunit GcvPA, partial [Candidatus Heimdallarchaeota archaeon]|nr:aminomethyl-transferring glycine dehydrogenase subunit GcvPA [Candidatus Heimdallarchaeota archaeon]
VVSFVGGGLKEQYIPAMIEELMRRGELYTSYTPYQPEISQGMLQILFEYQSMVAELLDMEVVNASMYDWASAVGEVLLVMCRITRRKRVILAGPISPKRIAVAKSYLEPSGHEIIIINEDGYLALDHLSKIIEEEKSLPAKNQTIAGIYFEVPSYYGTFPDQPQSLADMIHDIGGLVSVGVDPISLGIIEPPSHYGADFAVGEGQLLGNAINTGGPLLGILAAKYDKKWIRQLPGRLIGKTKELNSELPGYCITLSTREQHIRRDKATSNICTNESITAVNAAIYLAALGKQGIIELAQNLMDKAHYLSTELNNLDGVTSAVYEPFFNEFVVKFENISHESLEEKCVKSNYFPGIPVEGDGCLRLFSVSEVHSKDNLDNFVTFIKEVL